MLVKKIQKKLKSNQGTSIFFGLLLFLVASILSAVMLSASVTAVKRVESDRKAEQNYLTCSSAAKLLRDAIESTEIEKVTTVIETRNAKDAAWSSSGQPIEVWNKSTKNTAVATDKIADFLLDYVKSYHDYIEKNPASTASPTRKCIISVSNSIEEDKGMENVTADCTIGTGADGKGYTIIIKLRTGDGIDSCQIAVKLDGKPPKEESSTEVSFIKTGPNETDGYDQRTIKTTVTYGWEARDTIFGDTVRTSEAE